jgi:hypothetical protein
MKEKSLEKKKKKKRTKKERLNFEGVVQYSNYPEKPDFFDNVEQPKKN